MTNYRVAVIPGDLNGSTVTKAALQVADALKGRLTKSIEHTEFPYNADYFLDKGITELGSTELDVLKKYDQIFLGAIGDPTKIEPGKLEVGILLKIRQDFDQYVNLRPVVLPEGVPSVLVGKDHNDINFEICRENSEGLYVDAGWIENKGTDHEAGYQIMKCTYKGVRRLADFAVQRAIAREKADKPTVHVVFKTNVLTYAGAPWQRVYQEIKSEHEDIDVRYMHIDNFLMQMLQKPEQFDVIFTENMFGDIGTDAGAILQGGIGSAVSGNINPTGILPSMFEPIHGTAPDLWYEIDDGEYVPGTFVPEKVQKIRPEAACMSYAMLLEQMGEPDAARLMNDAALANLRDLDYRDKPLNALVEQMICFVSEAE